MDSGQNQVDAVRRIEKQKYYAETQPQARFSTATAQKLVEPEIIDTEEKSSIKNRSRKVILALIAILSSCAALLFIMLILFLTNIDLVIFKITLQGTVIDSETGTPIDNAKITLDIGEEATTDERGRYGIGNLVPTKVKMEVSAEGYTSQTRDVSITRSFLNYTVNEKFELENATRAGISGKLIGFPDGYSFVDDTLHIGEEKLSIQSNGTFTLQGNLVGKVELKYSSASFKDVEQEITIQPGQNTLKDITLEKAGDITGSLKSYIREDIVESPTFQVEGVSQSDIILDKEEGTFRIRDLTIDKEYKLRVSATGYETRDYTITIKQGENTLFDFALVEQGSTAFILTPEGERAAQIYLSDFDGQDIVQQTNQENVNPIRLDYTSGGSFILYTSEIERIRNSLGGYAQIIYSINPSNNSRQNVTTNTENIGTILPNFKAAKAINITRASGNFNSTIVEVMDLNGNNRKQVFALSNDDNFLDGMINNQGTIAVITIKTGTQVKLLRIDINTGNSEIINDKAKIELYDISPDGNRILFGATNTSSTFLDLSLYDKQSSETRSLATNADGKNYQFKTDSNTEFVYWADRADKTNIFAYNLSTGEETQVSRLGTDLTMSRIYQQGKLIFYVTDKGLYVIDPEKPQDYKQVVEGKVN